MDLSWRNIYLDLLFDAGYDGPELIETALDARSIRATDARQVGLRLHNPDTGRVIAALGAEFLPDQSGQLLVLVLSSGDAPEPRLEPEPGLSGELAEAVLAGTLREEAGVEQLGAGVLRFDRALMSGQSTPEQFRWLAGAVVRLLTVDVEALAEEDIAEVLGVVYEPHGELPSAEQEWPAFDISPLAGSAIEELPEREDTLPADEPETAGARMYEVDEAPEPHFEPEDAPEPSEEPEPALDLFEEPEPWLEDAEEPPVPELPTEEPPLDEARAEMIRLLTEDVEVSEAGDEDALPLEERTEAELEDLARDEIGDDAAEMLSREDLALLVEALRGVGAEGEEGEDIFEVTGEPEPPAEPVEPAEPWLEETAPHQPVAAEPDEVEFPQQAETPGDEVTPAEEPEPLGQPIEPPDEWLEEPWPAWLEAAEFYEETEAPAIEPAEGDEEADWLADYESILRGSREFEAEAEAEPGTLPEAEPQPEPEPEPTDEFGDEFAHWWETEIEPEPAEGQGDESMHAGPMPLRDMSRPGTEEIEQAPSPVEPPEEREDWPVLGSDEAALPYHPREWEEPAAEAAEVEQEERYTYPPQARERTLAGERTEYYLCAACGRYSAIYLGDNTYRCYRCESVIEYRLEPPRAPAEDEGSEP